MADRSVNININYKINTADIDKAKAASKAAQQATDNLRKSASVYGASAVKASNDAANSVKKVSDAAKKATIDTETLGKQFGNLGNYLKSIITLAAIKKLADISIEAVKLSGNVEGVQRAFNRAFPNSIQTLNDLRAATRGTVSDFELMQRTLQATNLGVAVEKLPILFEFAAARAQQTGESVDYLVDSIVRGIGRKSILILDNLGLSATRLKEQFNGASLASQSVADVTEGVAKIAQVELDKMGGYVDTSATKVSQLSAGWENLKATLSKALTARIDIIINNKGESLTAQFFNRLAASIGEASNDLLKYIMGTEELIKIEAENRASKLVSKIIDSEEFQSFKDNNEEKIKLLSLELVKQVELMNQRERAIKSIDEQIAAQDANTMAGGAAIEQSNKLRKVQELDRQTREQAVDILRKYIIELRNVTETGNEELDTLDALEAKLKVLNEQLQNTDKISTKSGVNQARVIKEQITSTQDKIDAIKLEIYWEEELARRRATLRKDKKGETVELRVDDQASSDLAMDINKSVQTAIDNIPPITMPAPTIPMSEWDKLGRGIEENMALIVQTVENIIKDQADFQLNSDVEMYNARIDAAHEFYDTQVELAGDNEKAKSDLRKKEEREIIQLTKKRAEAEKKAALGSIIVNTALGIIKAIATATSVYDGLIKSAVVAAEGASQYAIASKARYYAKGDIDIKGGQQGKDSIPAMLMPGESIMTTKETFKAKGILEMIRGNKLDDNILKQLQLTGSGVKYVGMSDDRIVSAIERQKYPDLVKMGSEIYEVKKSKDGISKNIRRKSMGNG